MVLMVQKKSNGKQTAEKKFSINFSKAKKKKKKKKSLGLHYNGNNSFILLFYYSLI